MPKPSGERLSPPNEEPSVESHRVDFGKSKEGRFYARCSCGWTYADDGLLACQLKASIHDL